MTHCLLRFLVVSLVVLAAALGTPALGEHSAPRADALAPPAEPVAPAKTDEATREREGTRLVSQLGRFKITGDRLTFQLAGGEKLYQGLENLALERIGKVLVDRHGEADELQWEVSGVFTEYRGTNYLLVTQAVLKSKGVRGSAVLSSAAR